MAVTCPVFYTLNVGMSRVQEIPVSIGVSEIFRRNALQLTTLPVVKYAYGITLWAAAELRLEVPEQVASAAAGGTEWAPFARPLYRFLSERFTSGSGRFFGAASGLRRRFASFATQTYLSIACYHYGEYADLRPPSRWPPLACTSRSRCRGCKASGHGFLMRRVRARLLRGVFGPPVWHGAGSPGVRGAQDALVKGFKWVLGQNHLGRSMLVPEFGLSIRSQIRKDELTTKAPRMLRAVKNACLGARPWPD